MGLKLVNQHYLNSPQITVVGAETFLLEAGALNGKECSLSLSRNDSQYPFQAALAVIRR